MSGAPANRVRGLIIAVAASAVIVAGAGYLWLNFDRLVEAVSSPANPDATPVVARDEDAVTLKDFQSFQQLTADSLKSATQDIEAERADLKTMSEQLATLTARIEAMQSTASIAPPQQPALARPQVTAERRKPPVPKPTGRISVGGAPLPPAQPDGH